MELTVRGNREIRVGIRRTGISSQGQAYRVLKWIKGAKIRTRNRNVIEMKQGFLDTRIGQGGSKLGVPVQGCTECNKYLG